MGAEVVVVLVPGVRHNLNLEDLVHWRMRPRWAHLEYNYFVVGSYMT